MKKTVRKLIVCLGVLAALAAGFFLIRSQPRNIPLDHFKLTDTYQYKRMKWNTSEFALRMSWWKPLEPMLIEDVPDNELLLFSRASAKLEGQLADTTFYFYEDSLYQVRFNVKDIKDDAQWVSRQLEKFVSVYGPATQMQEQGNLVIYKWEHGNSIMQIMTDTKGRQFLLILGCDPG